MDLDLKQHVVCKVNGNLNDLIVEWKYKVA